MKWLVILALLVIFVMFVVVRFRRQIQTGLYLLKMFRKMRQMSKPSENEKRIEPTTGSRDVQLVRCAKCESWIPQNTALKLSKNTYYCSSKCMEKTVELSR